MTWTWILFGIGVCIFGILKKFRAHRHAEGMNLGWVETPAMSVVGFPCLSGDFDLLDRYLQTVF